MNKILTGIFLFSLIVTSSAQQYFQQEVNYTINVKLNDVKHVLDADINFEYINNSPDTLRFIYIHLWPNAYKNNTTALAKQLLEAGNTKLYYSSARDKGYIDSLNFKENNTPLRLEYDPENIDIAKLYLSQPLSPGGKTNVNSPFRVKIPVGTISRLGHGGQSYQITQWYPKPAVYDKYGWHAMPYLNQGEFYSEFGSYDVSITLPQNYVLGATGDMVDGEKEIEWLNKNAAETNAIQKFDAKNNAFPPSSTETKTLRFKQSNVHDFAWFADKRYHVVKGEIELPHSKKTVTTWAMFTNEHADLWMKSAVYLQDAIYYYSLWNGDYPYNQVTAVDGSLSAGGGMEYPNITVISPVNNATMLETVIMHEVGHNWFYGILGSNEREHPWMDEGINSFNENRYLETKYPDQKLLDFFPGFEKLKTKFDVNHLMHKAQYELPYFMNARKNEDQAIDTHAALYTQANYGGVVYGKSALVFDYLMAYLGEPMMDKCMQAYFEKWKFKHPYPEDIQKVFEETTGKNLTWFFKDMITTTKKLDYKIIDFKKQPDNGYKILIQNTGDIAGPVLINGVKEGKAVSSAWYEGFNGKLWVDFPPGDYDMLKIDLKGDMPEINRRNNNIKTSGAFKKCEPLRLQWLASVENPNKKQLFYTPVIGWNNHNKVMTGLLLHNYTEPSRKFQYYLMPMYSFGNNDLAGAMQLSYSIYPNSNVFQSIKLNLSGKRYAFAPLGKTSNYNKITPEIVFTFKKKAARSKISNTLSLRSVNIIGDPFQTTGPSIAASDYKADTTYNIINQLTYTFKKNSAINPYSFNANLQQSKTFVKAFAEANLEITMKKKGKGLFVRLFGGRFLYNNNASNYFGFGMSGNTDYTFDHIFLGRSDINNLLSRQFPMNDGGFKQQTLTLFTTNWMTSINLMFVPNIPLPIGIYADAGYSATSGGLVSDAGIALRIAPNIFEIYFPVYTSSDLNMLTYGEKIRFVLNIHQMNPFKLLSNLSF